MSSSNEILMLQNVYAKLISTDETKLQSILFALLPRLLPKLSTTEIPVRNQVVIRRY